MRHKSVLLIDRAPLVILFQAFQKSYLRNGINDLASATERQIQLFKKNAESFGVFLKSLWL